jgi:hypothetical protein
MMDRLAASQIPSYQSPRENCQLVKVEKAPKAAGVVVAIRQKEKASVLARDQTVTTLDPMERDTIRLVPLPAKEWIRTIQRPGSHTVQSHPLRLNHRQITVMSHLPRRSLQVAKAAGLAKEVGQVKAKQVAVKDRIRVDTVAKGAAAAASHPIGLGKEKARSVTTRTHMTVYYLVCTKIQPALHLLPLPILGAFTANSKTSSRMLKLFMKHTRRTFSVTMNDNERSLLGGNLFAI